MENQKVGYDIISNTENINANDECPYSCIPTSSDLQEKKTQSANGQFEGIYYISTPSDSPRKKTQNANKVSDAQTCIENLSNNSPSSVSTDKSGENGNNHFHIENLSCFHGYVNLYGYQIEELLKMDGDFIIGVIFLHKDVNYIVC